MNRTAETTVLHFLQEAVFPKRTQNDLPAPVCAPQISPCHATQIISEFLAKAQHLSVSPSALLARSGPLRFPPLSQAEDNPEGEEILILHEDAKNITRQTRTKPPKAYNTCIGRWNSH